MDITDSAFIHITEAAIKEYPKELCGVIIEDKFIQLKNISETPETHFKFDPIEYLHYSECDAIIHSHTKKKDRRYFYDLRTPSQVDRVKCIESKKRWGIVGTDGETVTSPLWLPRYRNREYLGRPFIWFINDCYTLVQDYYYFELGIDLIDHAIEFSYEKGHKLQDKVFDKYIGLAGFAERDIIGELQKGELVLLNFKNVEQSHLGIFTGTGILHQDSLSVEVPLAKIRDKISRVLTHRSLL